VKYQMIDASSGPYRVVKIELVSYTVKERAEITQWLLDHGMPCDPVLGWNTGSVIHLDKADALMFSLRWT
jgi:hypothetical protein